MTFVAELEPKSLWEHFDEILKIPRGSKNEAAVRDYVIAVANRAGLEYATDDIGNVVVKKPATSGFEDSPGTILQSHLDMVNEKNEDVVHDFEKDPIQPLKDGPYLKARGTTLGADNGIGVAAALAVLESSTIAHGPVECLFTLDEETGLTGASALSPSILSGSYLINLDSEEEGAIYVGCAGGGGQNIQLPLESAQADRSKAFFSVSIRGLKGGHSGLDIHLQRGNAIQMLARCLHHALHSSAFQLVSFRGGNMRNAIAREATAVASVPLDRAQSFQESLEDRFSELRDEYSSAEADLQLNVQKASPGEYCLTLQSSKKLINLISAIPHGVISWSYDIPDLVETSSNLATCQTDSGTARIHVSTRSSVASSLLGVQERVEAVCSLAGADVERVEGYPGWKPNLDSNLLKITKDAATEVLGTEPEVKAIHAGLECGILKEKYPGLDIVSIGPEIQSPHSPDERVNIPSVEAFFSFLCRILSKL